MEIKKLNLGCGRDIRPGFVNIDQVNLPGIDKQYNLNKFPYPFEDNTFDYIIASHVIEHLDDPVRCIKEMHRISKPNGIIDLYVPHFASISAYLDPTHKKYFSAGTFKYFEKGHEYNYYFDYSFKILKSKITFPKYYSVLRPFISWFANRFQGFYEANLCHIIRPMYIEIRLRAIK